MNYAFLWPLKKDVFVSLPTMHTSVLSFPKTLGNVNKQKRALRYSFAGGGFAVKAGFIPRQ